ncbi:MAG: hypothetical protein SGPRY_012582, partial [Prymnesium sp.]
AMALLHCKAGEPHDALELMLQLSRPSSELFTFISEHSLQPACKERVRQLASHDWEATLTLLLDHVDQLPVGGVVAQLEGEDEPSKRRLHAYLHGLYARDEGVGAPFHGRQLQLYAELTPEQLLPFLRSSAHYSLEEVRKVICLGLDDDQEDLLLSSMRLSSSASHPPPHIPTPSQALTTCEAHGLTEACVFLLGRMGRNEDALTLLLEQMNDLSKAIQFVHDADDTTLWQSLVAHGMTSTELIDALLEHVCAAPFMRLDQAELVRQLPEGVAIPKLRQRLAKLVEQSANELELLHACLQVAQADYLGLIRRRHRYVRAGTICSPG